MLTEIYVSKETGIPIAIFRTSKPMIPKFPPPNYRPVIPFAGKLPFTPGTWGFEASKPAVKDLGLM